MNTLRSSTCPYLRLLAKLLHVPEKPEKGTCIIPKCVHSSTENNTGNLKETNKTKNKTRWKRMKSDKNTKSFLFQDDFFFLNCQWVIIPR